MKINKTKFKNLLDRILWILLVLWIGCVDLTPSAEASNSSYLCLYADFPLRMFHLAVLLVLIVIGALSKSSKDKTKEKNASTASIIVTLIIFVITVIITVIMSGYYDAIRIDPANGDSFVSHKPFREPAEYTVHDVAEAELHATYGMSLHMNDGTEIHLICGYERESAEFFEEYESAGKYVSDLFAELSDKGVPVTVNNREKIESKLAKESDSGDPHFTEYLPKILELSKEP